MWTTLASLRVDHIPTDSTTINFINFFKKLNLELTINIGVE